jgi:hypothetical protein
LSLMTGYPLNCPFKRKAMQHIKTCVAWLTLTPDGKAVSKGVICDLISI